MESDPSSMDNPSDETSENQPEQKLSFDSLEAALAHYDLFLDEDQIEQLDTYRHLLWEWNSKINLTRHTTIDKFVARDLVDTLELAKHLEPESKVLDIGSGGGVPGIPLAILRPDLDLSLCESVVKKANVLQTMVEDLGLNAQVFANRAEDVLQEISYDILIARAVAPLWKFMFWLKPHKKAFNKLLLIKGPAWVNERGEARHRGVSKGFDLRRENDYPTPGTDMVSTVLSITPSVSKKSNNKGHRNH